jgi:hypothetical protein
MSNTFKVRSYIEAKSAKRLRFLMYKKQIELSMQSLEFDIVVNGKKFYAWYYDILKTEQNLVEIIDGQKDD